MKKFLDKPLWQALLSYLFFWGCVVAFVLMARGGADFSVEAILLPFASPVAVSIGILGIVSVLVIGVLFFFVLFHQVLDKRKSLLDALGTLLMQDLWLAIFYLILLYGAWFSEFPVLGISFRYVYIAFGLGFAIKVICLYLRCNDLMKTAKEDR